MNASAWLLLVAFLAPLLLLAWPLSRALDAVMQGRFAWGRRMEAPCCHQGEIPRVAFAATKSVRVRTEANRRIISAAGTTQPNSSSIDSAI